MLKHFISLQWKSFFRAASLKSNLAIKILTIFMALYLITIFIGAGISIYFIIEKAEIGNPFDIINKYVVYYIVGDLFFRYMLQKMPVTNIKPLLYLPFKKNQVVHFSLGKTILSFFNWTHAFFFIPFSIILITKDYSVLGVISWHLAMIAIIYSNNFINILANNKDNIFYTTIVLFAILGLCQYFQVFDITLYTTIVFDSFYSIPWSALIMISIAISLYYATFHFFKRNMYLDAGLKTKQDIAKSEDLSWLNRFGNLGTFLKNDIKLIKRNKRSKMSVIMSIAFIFYGFLFFSKSISVYEGPVWKIFAGIFISGGFLFSFGQFVPSWDSSYYPLLMSQNIKYKEYLDSKWYLIVIATLVSTIIASFYLYFGIDAYLAIIVGGIYNIGVNSYLVLLGGAFIKTPIDLTSSKKAFGDKQSFNLKTMILTLPKLVLPLIIYALGHYLINPTAGYLFVAFSGIIGFAFKNYMFKKIEQVYKKEKYKTIAAYKQAN
ncbi:hypothetical protein KO500_05870 [Cellulophaga baltica]|uniref:DUF5687 family protein n=1 Tax=Cellulophaga TaxID=104264 RepID=UPI001C0668AC|nr:MULTISPECIES: DUF5687 family protein [Cellulophaga]MBU2995949.1 hypothetical protein [Cellulophaga baltica]MDO6767344.1 DUF5687 family protein [Cellulophaga sp. 1_MG-2023]